MAMRGISTGHSDGTFRANDAVNRDAMAAFFYRMAGSPSYTAPSASVFKDIKSGDQFYKEISWLADQKISTGWSDGIFRLDHAIERGAMVAFLYGFT